VKRQITILEDLLHHNLLSLHTLCHHKVVESLGGGKWLAPGWCHLLALTLLNAHPALTGTFYGIR
jgi:hypothetical protein